MERNLEGVKGGHAIGKSTTSESAMVPSVEVLSCTCTVYRGAVMYMYCVQRCCHVHVLCVEVLSCACTVCRGAVTHIYCV